MAEFIRRGRNKWLVRVFKGRDGNGRRIFANKTITGTKEDAENWAYDQKRQQTTSNPLIAELLDDLILDYKVNGKSLAWAKIVCDVHLRPVFGSLKASKMTTEHAKRYMEARQEVGRKNATINRELALLRRSFNLARRHTPPKVAAVPYIPTLEENNVRKGFFEDEQYQALLTKLPEDIRPILAFGYYTGARKGEILSLQWSQVDLIEREVRLEPGETKNDEGRQIPLVPELFEILVIEKRRRDQNYPGSPWVFTDGTGRAITSRYLRPCWEDACKHAGLWQGDPDKGKPTRLFHDLRRSAVRNLVRAGVSETVAMKVSGHKTREVFDRYNITSDADLKDSAVKLARYHEDRRKQVPSEPPAKGHTIVTQESVRLS